MKYITAAAFLCILIFSTAYSQQVIRETVAPTGVPSAGYSICWIDAGTHVLNCRNAAGETYQPGALEASGQLRVVFANALPLRSTWLADDSLIMPGQ